MKNEGAKDLWREAKEEEKGKYIASLARPADGFYNLEPLIQGVSTLKIFDDILKICGRFPAQFPEN